MNYQINRRQLIKSLVSLGLVAPLAGFSADAPATKGNLFVDGLSFLPDDLNDLRRSKLDAYLCDISDIEAIKQPDGTTNYKRTYQACIKSIKQARIRVENNPKKLILGDTSREIVIAQQNEKTAVYFQIQGADCIEQSIGNDLAQLDEFYNLGLRVLQLTHHYGNKFAGGALDNVNNQGINLPLTPAGRRLIERLNLKNMLVDISHSSEQTALDVAKVTQSPIVQSHGAVRSIVNHARCSPDNVIKAIADTGGLFGVFMMTFWLTYDKVPTTDHYIAQLKHVMNIGGIDSVAIANDYSLRGQKKLLELHNDNSEGVKQYIPWWHSLRARGVLGFEHEPNHVVIPHLNHIDRMERIDAALARHGFSANHRDKIMGKNWHRVLTSVLG